MTFKGRLFAPFLEDAVDRNECRDRASAFEAGEGTQPGGVADRDVLHPGPVPELEQRLTVGHDGVERTPDPDTCPGSRADDLVAIVGQDEVELAGARPESGRCLEIASRGVERRPRIEFVGDAARRQ